MDVLGASVCGRGLSLHQRHAVGVGRRASCLPDLMWDAAVESEPQASGCQPQLLSVTLNNLSIPVLSGPSLTAQLDDKTLLSALKSDRVQDRCGTDVALLIFFKKYLFVCARRDTCEPVVYGGQTEVRVRSLHLEFLRLGFFVGLTLAASVRQAEPGAPGPFL